MIDNLINWIRQIESGKVQIDNSEKMIRSNVTTNLMLRRITDITSHNLHAKVFDWQVVSGLAYNAYELICSGRNNPNYNILEIIQKNEQLQKRVQVLESQLSSMEQSLRLHHKERMMYVRA